MVVPHKVTAMILWQVRNACRVSVEGLCHRGSVPQRLRAVQRHFCVVPDTNPDDDNEMSDMIVHTNFVQELEAEVGKGAASNLLFQLEHPLMKKYNFSVNEFCVGARDALQNVFDIMQTVDMKNVSVSYKGLSFLDDICATDPAKIFLGIARKELAIDDVQARIKNELSWFESLGINNMEYNLDVTGRKVSLHSLTNANIRVTQRRVLVDELADDNIESFADKKAADIDEGDEEHVLIDIDASFYLLTVASLNYFVPGPPRYDLRVRFTSHAFLIFCVFDVS